MSATTAPGPVRREEILSITEFQAARTRLQARLTEIKGARRLQLGDASVQQPCDAVGNADIATVGRAVCTPLPSTPHSLS